MISSMEINSTSTGTFPDEPSSSSPPVGGWVGGGGGIIGGGGGIVGDDPDLAPTLAVGAFCIILCI